ncbi:3'-5' exonuclease [Methylobacterium sp. Leaf118]|uniref:3'-5' exonuclease n=1 Tax=Methylobacterium sp. Leaf118 TaxID=2876562 RepID=UPI001E613BDD|nr:3'-5' exonuclease [Methylobacterium sp. Leaf118]
MPETVLVFDLETVPDLAAVARVHGLDPDDTDGARAKLGGGFPKLIYHAIVCIGALIAERMDEAWQVRALGAPHIGERSEAQLIIDFAARLDQLRPQLVSFNGHGFDLPVIRYRALVHGIAAPGLTARPYYRRYDEAGLDLCDVLANHDARGRIGLDALCRAMGLQGKPEGLDGGGVAELVAQGRLQDVAAYCQADLIATYRIFLAYEHLRGKLSPVGYNRSIADLDAFRARTGATYRDAITAFPVEAPTPSHAA